MAPNLLFKAWLHIHSSLWFVPVLMVLAAIALNIVLTAIDIAFPAAIASRWPFLQISGDGARSIFGSVASALITLAGVIYSITIVTLTMAANQYSSRVLRAFMSDRGNQIVLGYFTAVFTYSLVLLRTIRSGDGGAEFVPTLAALAGMLLAVATVGFLIYFINHVSESIQASHVVASIAQATVERIDALFESRKPGGGEPEEEKVEAEDGGDWRPVPAEETGYIQSIALEDLVREARRHGTVVRMEHPVGGFVVRGMPLAWTRGEAPPALAEAVHDAVATGYTRTLDQDPNFGIRQIVDVALKALSPGINDSTTAVTCVDYLTAILMRLAARDFPPCRHYRDGMLCAITKGAGFESALNTAFHEIRQNAKGNVAVILRQLESLERLGAAMPEPPRRQMLRRQAQMIAEAADRAIESPHDRAVVDARMRKLAATLERPAPAPS